MEIPLLTDILIIFGLSIGVLLLCRILRLPTIVGYLLTGVLVGPYGLGLIDGVHEVEVLAEIGVVLLLFTIGIEFSLRELYKLRKQVFIGGAGQVILSILLVAAAAFFFSGRAAESIFLGFLVSLSSTAIVLKLLQERAEIDAPHGRMSLAILIFQDVAVIPMMLITPLLVATGTGMGSALAGPLLALMAKAVLLAGIVLVASRWLVPPLLFQIARARSRELFMVSIVVIGLAVAWLTARVGLSFALGAFLAGLIISESEYGHHALASILPFRDVFTSLFFVSIGMLFDINLLWRQPLVIILLAVVVLAIKSLAAGGITRLLKYPIRISILVGLGLAQVGEFSFILLKEGVKAGLVGGSTYQMFLAVSIVTMLLTPFLITVSPAVAGFVSQLGIPKHERKRLAGNMPVNLCLLGAFNDHVVIIGYGLNGKNVAHAARGAGISYAIIDMNPETVREERVKGEPIFFGDATHAPVLEQVSIGCARVAVVAISDAVATRRATSEIRRMNPGIYIIARTRYLQEMKPLHELGADEVIPEEFETSVEIFTRILDKYMVPLDEIEKYAAEIRAGGYDMLRNPSRERRPLADLDMNMPDTEISSIRVSAGSEAAGKSLVELHLRSRYGANILAIRRNGELITNPGGDTRLEERDVVVAMGKPEVFPQLAGLFRSQLAEPPDRQDNGAAA